MTDTPTPRPETRALITRLVEGMTPPQVIGIDPAEMKLLLALLPADLVAAATVEMPKEPGLYVGPGGTRGPVWRVETTRDFVPHREGGSDTAEPSDGPFRRLVAESEVDRAPHVFTGVELATAFHVHAEADPWDRVANHVNTYTEEAGR